MTREEDENPRKGSTWTLAATIIERPSYDGLATRKVQKGQLVWNQDGCLEDRRHRRSTPGVDLETTFRCHGLAQGVLPWRTAKELGETVSARGRNQVMVPWQVKSHAQPDPRGSSEMASIGYGGWVDGDQSFLCPGLPVVRLLQFPRTLL